MEKKKKLATLAACFVAIPAFICFLFAIFVFFFQNGVINPDVFSWVILACIILFSVALCIDIYLFITQNVSFALVVFPILLVVSCYAAFDLIRLIGLHPLFWLSCIATITFAMITLLANSQEAR